MTVTRWTGSVVAHENGGFVAYGDFLEVSRKLEEARTLLTCTEHEADCAEDWLDHYAAQLNLEQTEFDCLGDYVKAVVEAALAR